MTNQQLRELVKKYHYDLVLYSAELMELRIQEEMVRADARESAFGYLEFEFNTMKELRPSNVDTDLLWRKVFEALSYNIRGSDLKGLLPDNRGICIVFLDSASEHCSIIRQRILHILSTNGAIIRPPAPKEQQLFPMLHYPKSFEQATQNHDTK
jgi:hypothetical protein